MAPLATSSFFAWLLVGFRSADSPFGFKHAPRSRICELIAAKPQEGPEAIRLLVAAMRDKEGGWGFKDTVSSKTGGGGGGTMCLVLRAPSGKPTASTQLQGCDQRAAPVVCFLLWCQTPRLRASLNWILCRSHSASSRASQA